MKTGDSYVIGIDFGSDSVRSLLVHADTGEEMVSSVHYYTRWAQGQFCNPSENKFRQHPLDYMEGLEKTISEIVSKLPQEAVNRIIGIGVDTTGSTPVAVDAHGTPLSLLPEFSENPNAMFVLWKDHTAIKEAYEINMLCSTWSTDYSKYAGGIYSSEWFWSKILHITRNDSSVREAAYSWVEHCDWIPFLLTGGTQVKNMKRSRCAAGHKALWHASFDGLPSQEFFTELDPLLNGIRERMFTETYTSNISAGTLSPDWAKRLGLSEQVVVSVGAFDAHMGAVGARTAPYFLTKIMGTSTCDILVAPKHEHEKLVKGICGQVDGSVIPGMLGLEAGQSAFGDIYAWYERLLAWPLHHLIGNAQSIDTETKAKLIHETVSAIIPELSKAASLESIGASGELALDWMNGRRTPDANQNLTGTIAGINLGSTSPKIFRALVEASCFGAKTIVDRFEEEGISIIGIIALGGVAKKSPYIMQMMSDVLNRPIKVVKSEQACALGASIFAAVAAGRFASVQQAMGIMGSTFDKTYLPETAHVEAYERVYATYKKLGITMEAYIMNQNNGR